MTWAHSVSTGEPFDIEHRVRMGDGTYRWMHSRAFPRRGPDGAIVWVSGPLPGAVHDIKAARIWGIVRALADAGLLVLADKGYIGAGEHVKTPYKGRNKPESQKQANKAHARLRSPGSRHRHATHRILGGTQAGDRPV